MINCKKKRRGRLTTEFCDILDPRGRAVLLELDEWIGRRFGKVIVITCLGRTEEENTAIDGSQYSAHLIKDGEWVRGFDLRSRIYSSEEVDLIVDHLEKTWNQNGKFLHIVATKHGTGPHIHIDIRWMYRIAK